MKPMYLLAGCLCLYLCAFAIMPAQAITAKALIITLDPAGNAQVDYQYSLSFTEQIAVFATIADPSAELRSALTGSLGSDVTVEKADTSSAEVYIPSFASVSSSGGGAATMTTPAFSFAHAQDAIRQYWWSPLISADLSPHVTTIVFPDGYQATFNDRIAIPQVSHQLAAGSA